MHPSLRLPVAASLVLSVFIGLSFISGIEGQDSKEEGVCYCYQWKVVYEWTNVSYSCWKVKRVTGPECNDGSSDGTGWIETDGHHHRRWKRTWGSDWRTDDDYDADDDDECYFHTLEVCYRRERRCYRRYERVKYCCNGYEDDGNGGCKMAIKCGSNNGGCNQMCISSTSDRHFCRCMPGFILINDTTCVDVDECREPGRGGCQKDCVNTEGSYYCKCPPGYDMISATECQERDECLYGNGGCEHDCVNTDGTYHCLCREGFKLLNGNECLDVDECQHLNGGCSHVCVNHFGGYRCLCPDGLELFSDGRTCIGEGGPGSRPTYTEPSPPIEAEQKGGDGSLSGGAIAGITLGALIGLACLIALLLLLLCLGRRLLARGSANSAGQPPPYTESISVLPVPLPVKKALADDDEKGGNTNMAYNNEMYGTVWGDDMKISAKREPSELDFTPSDSEPVYGNSEALQPKLEEAEPVYGNAKALPPKMEEAEPVYGNVDLSSGKTKPVAPPRPGKTQAYDNAANAKIVGDG